MRRWMLFAAAVVVLVVGVVVGARLFPRRVSVNVQGPVVTLPGSVDTIHVTDGDAARRVEEYRRIAEAFKDSAAAARAERESWQHAADLWQGSWYRADSTVAELLARSSLFAEVQYRRGTVAAIASRDDSLYAAPAWRCWRNTWTLSATPAGPVLRWRRMPVDFGWFVAADGVVPIPRADSFDLDAWAGVSIRPSAWWQIRIGPCWSWRGGPGARVGVEWGGGF